MKKIINFLMLSLFIIYSCSDQNLEEKDFEIINKATESSVQAKQSLSATTCNFSAVGGSSTECCPGDTQIFSATTDLSNPSFSWSVLNGNMAIVGSSTGQTVTVSFGSSFNQGELRLNVLGTDGSATDVTCGEIKTLSDTDCTNVPICNEYPGIYIRENIPVCYPSYFPYGRYQLSESPGLYTTITWSVNYGQITLDSGIEVHVAASSSHPFTLTANITEGDCTKEIKKVIYPRTDCDFIFKNYKKE